MEVRVSIQGREGVRFLVFCVVVGLGWAQAQVIGPGAQQEVKTAANVPMDAPVITLQGFCPGEDLFLSGLGTPHKADATPLKKSGANACQTIVTRAQFEKLNDAAQPLPGPVAKTPPSANFRLAYVYSDALIFAERALEQGVDKDPTFQEQMRFARLQVLSDNLKRKLKERAEDVSDADVAKFYKDHPEEYAEANLQRIFVPKHSEHDPNPNFASKSAASDEAKMRAVAEKIQTEASGGEDFVKLQQKAYEAAGLEDPPNIEMGATRESELPESDRKTIFALQPGEVSPVMTGDDGYFILKMLSKRMIPLENAKAIMTRRRMQQYLDDVKKSAKKQFSEEFFGPPAVE
jgi:hypothetical protein